jgi:hypothetical protein
MCSSSVATCMDLLDSLVHSLVYQDCLACRDTIARLLRCAASSGTGWLFNFHYVFCLSNRRNEPICLFCVFIGYSLFGPICFVWFQLLDCILDIQNIQLSYVSIVIQKVKYEVPMCMGLLLHGQNWFLLVLFGYLYTILSSMKFTTSFRSIASPR